jgi:hypothetical protein
MAEQKYFNPDDSTDPGWTEFPRDPLHELLAEVAREMVRERELPQNEMPPWAMLEPRDVLLRVAARALTAVERMDAGARPMSEDERADDLAMRAARRSPSRARATMYDDE